MLILEPGLIYLQIYNYYKKEIITGNLPSDAKLPSKRQLADQYQVAINTVENAYSKLLEEGFIYSKQRQGYFVADVGELYIADPIENEQQPETTPLKYDFSYRGVAKEGFPYKTFRKISANVIDDIEHVAEPDYQGYYPLRQQIAAYLQKARGFSVKPEQIIISSGSEYLYQIIFKLVGGIYAIEDPGYQMLPNIMDINQIDYVSLPIDENGMSITALNKTNANICIITPAHQFPTGIIMNMKRRTALLNRTKTDYVVEDDYDSEFKYSKQPVPALKSIDYNDKVIYMGSFSKAISPAFRVSFMVLPESLLDRYQNVYSCFSCPVSLITQKILTEFISTGEFEKHLNRMRKIYAKKRQIVVEAFQQRPDIKITGSDGGLHLVLQYPKHYTEAQIVTEAKKHNIKVYGIHNYTTSKNPQPELKDERPAIVLGFATMTEEQLKEGLTEFLKI